MLADGYVDGNFNDPASGFNGLRNFDVRADTAHLSMGMLTIDHGPAPVGFHLDAGFGEAFDIIHATDRAPDEMKYIQQAYVSFKPKSWHGIEVDAGEFWSPASTERVVPTNQDWNYSRSLLFAWAIPCYHFGIRASFPVGAHFTGGVQVMQGWNNVEDNNSGKTVGINGAYVWKKVAWTNIYMGARKRTTPIGDGGISTTRRCWSSPPTRSGYYVNFDYGRENNMARERNGGPASPPRRVLQSARGMRLCHALSGLTIG